jgi:predicted nucleotidyltransferase
MSIDLEPLRPQIAALCAEYGIAELAVFGSVARGDDDSDSDVDLLYVVAPSTVMGFVRLSRLQEEFEELLGRPVDLVPKVGLHWVIRDRVLADSKVLYAAA